VFAVAAHERSLHGLAIGEHGPVLVVTAEDSYEDWQRKASAIHYGTNINVEAAFEEVFIRDLSDGEARLSEVVSVREDDTTRRVSRATAMQDEVIAQARRVGANLIVVETASRLVEDEDNASFAALQSALGRIARKTGAAVVVTHHATKAASKENDASIENARGGGAFIYNARNAITLFPARPEVAKRYSDRFAACDLFELIHGKSTSSTKREGAIVLARVGTEHGAVFERPEDVVSTPESEAAAKARRDRERRARLERLQRVYSYVEGVLATRPHVSPSYLANECHQEIGFPKREVKKLVEDAIAAGFLNIATRSARGDTLALGRDPRKETGS
jgi:RecA-family ATPase